MDLKQLVVLALQVSIVAIVFSFGLRSTLDDLTYLWRRPGLLVRSLIAVLVVMPVIAVILVRVFNLRDAVEVSLVALAISPMPPLLPKRGVKAGGRQAYAMALMVTLAALAIVTVPLAVRLLGMYFGRPFALAPAAIARIVVVTVFLPLVAGLIVRAFAPGIAARLSRAVGLAATALLVLASLVLLSAVWRGVWAAIGDGTVIAIVAFVLLGLLVGHLMGGPDPDESLVLALGTACRHPAIGLTIASTNFPDERFGGTILLYLLVGLVLGVPYLAWCRRRLTDGAGTRR
jgi:BASS family bile acid:Na+ symporter